MFVMSHFNFKQKCFVSEFLCDPIIDIDADQDLLFEDKIIADFRPTRTDYPSKPNNF